MGLKTGIEGLKIEKWSLEYAKCYAKYANNYNIWKNLRDEFPYPYEYCDAVNFINIVGLPSSSTHFAIVYNGECIGDIHISLQDDIRRYNGELGYWLAEPFWGKGFMTEVVKTIIRYGFEELNLIRIYAKVFSTNAGSIKVLEKCGFVQEGYFKKAIIKEGKILDQVLYAILNMNWENEL